MLNGLPAPCQHAAARRHQQRRQRVATPTRVAAPDAPTDAAARAPRPAAGAPQQLPSLQRPTPAQLLQEIVAPVGEDMRVLNANLRAIVGDRHPMLLAAADQIFGAGGKKLRPMIVLLMARATAELGGLT
jgi:all-trans-nonaprenyl-diphosphate synthase